jgi:Mrp family chromosome partitioning ATPase
MSRHFAVLGKGASADFPASHPGNLLSARSQVESASPSGEYLELIRHLFLGPTAVAVVGGNSGRSTEGVSAIVQSMAAELAAFGKRVVIVPVNQLLLMNSITAPDEQAFAPGDAQRIWFWPSSASQKIEFFKSRESDTPGNWLDVLRRNFDSVLLDCPHVEGAPGVSEVGAMADAAVLVVETGLTSKQQIRQDQRALQLRGARVAGSILIRRT